MSEVSKPLGQEKVGELLGQIPAWTLNENGKSISRERTFPTFLAAVNFVNEVANIAEKEDHHPDIHLLYNRVRLDLSTHSAGGLSDKDFILAAKIDKLTRF